MAGKTFAFAVALTTVLAAAPDAGRWPGPGEFVERDGAILGPWWNGGALGVACYTGPGAQVMDNFIKTGERLAGEMGMLYQEIHAADVRPSEPDPNGCLLYPDGAARCRLLIMPGGVSTITTMELAGVETRDEIKAKAALFPKAAVNFQQAFATGMNYLGACGGFFTASSGFSVPSVCTAFCLWPGQQQGLGPLKKEPFPNLVFAPGTESHPLFRTSDNGVVKGLWYNGGPLGVQSGVPDTEYLARYAGGAMPGLEGDWGLIAYRPADNPRSGRLVLCTGHPEIRHARLLDAMADYACGHLYEVPDRLISPGVPVDAVIGDRQMHYYRVTPDPGGGAIHLRVSGSGAERCRVLLRHGLPPTFSSGQFSPVMEDGQWRFDLPETKSGSYYLGIYGDHDQVKGLPYRAELLGHPGVALPASSRP